jgi:hypothetical protein
MHEVSGTETPVTDGFAVAAFGDEVYLVSAKEVRSAPVLDIQTFECK